MAANFEMRKPQPPADNALRVLMRRGRSRGLAGLALSVALALAVPSTAAISHGIDAAPVAGSAASAPSSDASADAAPQRRPSASTPRPMSSGDRQAIFMVMMLQGQNASSQILGLTH